MSRLSWLRLVAGLACVWLGITMLLPGGSAGSDAARRAWDEGRYRDAFDGWGTAAEDLGEAATGDLFANRAFAAIAVGEPVLAEVLAQRASARGMDMGWSSLTAVVSSTGQSLLRLFEMGGWRREFVRGAAEWVRGLASERLAQQPGLPPDRALANLDRAIAQVTRALEIWTAALVNPGDISWFVAPMSVPTDVLMHDIGLAAAKLESLRAQRAAAEQAASAPQGPQNPEPPEPDPTAGSDTDTQPEEDGDQKPDAGKPDRSVVMELSREQLAELLERLGQRDATKRAQRLLRRRQQSERAGVERDW